MDRINPMEMWGIIFGIGGLILAGISAIIALSANKRASTANKEAQVANNIASQALVEAKESNRIAEAANELSQQANSILESQARKEVDDSFFDWVCEWDEEALTLNIINRGANSAFQVATVVNRKNFPKARDTHGTVGVGQQVSLKFPDVPDNRINKHRVLVMTTERTLYGDYIEKLEIEIVWFTEFGNRKNDIVHHSLK